MNNEEFQKLVLEQLSKINARLDNIEGQVKKALILLAYCSTEPKN